MGLFVRKTEIGTHAPLYSFGAEKTILIVGLGNIGQEYDNTRHNIGFDCVDEYQKTHDFTSWQDKKNLFCQHSSATIGGTKVILVKPTTYMNESGRAVQATQAFYKLSNAETFVIHDELDIDFGTIRTRIGGGSAGHNGIKSITQHCGEEYGRIRVGIGPKTPQQIDSADFVLAKFSQDEAAKLKSLHKEVCNIVDELTASHKLPEQTRKIL